MAKLTKMGISIGIKEIKYPKYVNDLFAELSDEKKERIVKSVIFQNVEEIESDDEYKYKISPFFQEMSNRVEFLPKKSVIASISLTESLLIHKIFEERKDDDSNSVVANER